MAKTLTDEQKADIRVQFDQVMQCINVTLDGLCN